MLVRYWYWFAQTLIWPLSWLLIRFFYSVEIKGAEKLKNLKLPVIIASNHKTLFDAFLVGSSLPFGSRFFPFRYMTEEIDFRGAMLRFLSKIKFLKTLYFLTGGFPSRRGQGADKAIELPVKLLKKGNTILMFPEGKLVRENSLGTFYPGVVKLSIAAGVPILPFSFYIKNRKISVRFGEIFMPDSEPERALLLLKTKIETLLKTAS
ncbi:hypothetical protein A2Z53_01660 [Candidatus Giovannonibacteria bacterium RIFCSPHIGHO2_02_42_15]|uniref:Phospholipid/glycerol acyltransferase domain-containing protein n=2 Tax=Candidatus Giovannoniibacteriota TaxID=1752738 RepID=A0A1F5VPM0_9BACT|nr:MAG: Phospholipid/glycerol acyltransferase [Candidatus Giovannonibacteria bacterium GW2011_GWF2_42_19]OGF65307.1 MAG: hypothetical protein A2Z53_01660 [Candidatus Giovannonibacteria bacterium RIFCSPHIGHO2_02_42_15]